MEHKNDYKKKMLNILNPKRYVLFIKSKYRLFKRPESAPDLELLDYNILSKLFKKFENPYYKYMEIESKVKDLKNSKSRMDDEIIPNLLEEKDEQLKLMFFGVVKILSRYNKYSNYGMYREKLLKIYALISKNL